MALGRKNWLFCGSDAGGQRAAYLYTIVETVKLNELNPRAYLTDVQIPEQRRRARAEV